MKAVAEILKGKTHVSIISVSPEINVLEAITLMTDTDISALMVIDNGRIAGIVTERDYVRRVARLQLIPQQTRVSEVMTRDLITVSPKDQTRFCMQLMIEKNLRHLPVLEDGKLVGLLSIRDLVKDVVAEQEGLINHLEQYIRGE
jgi:CBS domain-containing protein